MPDKVPKRRVGPVVPARGALLCAWPAPRAGAGRAAEHLGDTMGVQVEMHQVLRLQRDGVREDRSASVR
jgi:hypothetical protein